MTISEQEYEMLMRCSQAIDLLADFGHWHQLNGELVYYVDEETADRIWELVSND